MDRLQAAVIAALLTKDGWSSFGSALSEDVFNDADTRALYMALVRLHPQTGSDLTYELLGLDIMATYGGRGRGPELLEKVQLLAAMPQEDADVVRQAVARFASRELSLQAARYIASRADGDSYDVNHAQALLDRAVDLSSGVDTSVIDFDGADLPGEDDYRSGLVPTGLSSELDSCLAGGYAAGELLTLLAPPARGKTSYLWAILASAVRQGRNGLGITLEISVPKCIRRVDQWLTGFTPDELIMNRAAVAASRKLLAGQIWVKDWAYKGITADDIKALVTRMRQKGQKVDVIMVDYLEHMAPIVKRREERLAYGQTCKELRMLAQDLDVGIITAWQVNRAGSDSHVLTQKDVSESWEVVKHSDIILGLNQNDEELLNKVLRVNIIKQREGTVRKMFYLHSDLDRMVIHKLENPVNEDEPVPVHAVDNMPGNGRAHAEGRKLTLSDTSHGTGPKEFQ